MIVSAIAALDRTGLIGDGLTMPWHLPRDLRRFRKHTLGKPVVMGRRTLESLREPLPGRLNIVLTREPAFGAAGVTAARSIEEALKCAEGYLAQNGGDEVMLIGGGVVFEATASLWDRLLLTVVDGRFKGNTYFPLPRLKDHRWRLLDQECFGVDAKNAHPHWFLDLERREVDGSGHEDFDLLSWLGNSPLTLQ